MKTRFVVASVPHSGTLTVQSLMTTLGIEHQRLHMGWGKLSTGQQPNLFKYILPLRNPDHVWLTYWNRGLPTDNLRRDWGHLAELASQDTSFVLPVDKMLPPDAWSRLASFLELKEDRYSQVQLAGFLFSTFLNKHDYPPMGEGVPYPSWLDGLRKQWGYN